MELARCADVEPELGRVAPIDSATASATASADHA